MLCFRCLQRGWEMGCGANASYSDLRRKRKRNLSEKPCQIIAFDMADMFPDSQNYGISACVPVQRVSAVVERSSIDCSLRNANFLREGFVRHFANFVCETILWCRYRVIVRGGRIHVHSVSVSLPLSAVPGIMSCFLSSSLCARLSFQCGNLNRGFSYSSAWRFAYL